MIAWIIYAVIVLVVVLYCRFATSCGHVPDFRKPFSVLALVIYTIIMLVFCSCSSIKYVPVETVRTEYKTRDSIRYDSIYQRDSIYMQLKGDSVYLYKYKYLYRYLTINKTDTVLKTDSIQVPYPIEKELTRWQEIKIELGGWAFGIIISFGLIIVGWLVYKWRNK